ncbi:MAG: hypothetical protein R3E89_08495 [Thiolinea sp.]
MLLAAYLKQYAEGDIRRRDTLPPLLSEDVSADNWQGQRIMLARQTLQDSPKLTLLYLVSVFDQPVQRELLAELMRAIGKGLSDRFPQVSIGSIAGWQKVAAMCAGFTAAGIVAGQSSGIWTLHPLVRNFSPASLRCRQVRSRRWCIGSCMRITGMYRKGIARLAGRNAPAVQCGCAWVCGRLAPAGLG